MTKKYIFSTKTLDIGNSLHASVSISLLVTESVTFSGGVTLSCDTEDIKINGLSVTWPLLGRALVQGGTQFQKVGEKGISITFSQTLTIPTSSLDLLCSMMNLPSAAEQWKAQNKEVVKVESPDMTFQLPPAASYLPSQPLALAAPVAQASTTTPVNDEVSSFSFTSEFLKGNKGVFG